MLAHRTGPKPEVCSTPRRRPSTMLEGERPASALCAVQRNDGSESHRPFEVPGMFYSQICLTRHSLGRGRGREGHPPRGSQCPLVFFVVWGCQSPPYCWQSTFAAQAATATQWFPAVALRAPARPQAAHASSAQAKARARRRRQPQLRHRLAHGHRSQEQLSHRPVRGKQRAATRKQARPQAAGATAAPTQTVLGTPTTTARGRRICEHLNQL